MILQNRREKKDHCYLNDSETSQKDRAYIISLLVDYIVNNFV